LDSKTRAKIKSVTLTLVAAEEDEDVTAVAEEAAAELIGLQFVDGNGTSVPTPLAIKPLTANGQATTWTATDLAKISISELVIPSSFGSKGEEDTAKAIITVKGEGDDIIGTYPVELKRTLDVTKLFTFSKTPSLYVLPIGENKGTVSLESIFDETFDPSRLEVSSISIKDGDGEITKSLGDAPLALTIPAANTKDVFSKTYTVKVSYNYGYVYSEQQNILKQRLM
jgi:hypothetical protein